MSAEIEEPALFSDQDSLNSAIVDVVQQVEALYSEVESLQEIYRQFCEDDEIQRIGYNEDLESRSTELLQTFYWSALTAAPEYDCSNSSRMNSSNSNREIGSRTPPIGVPNDTPCTEGTAPFDTGFQVLISDDYFSIYSPTTSPSAALQSDLQNQEPLNISTSAVRALKLENRANSCPTLFREDASRKVKRSNSSESLLISPQLLEASTSPFACLISTSPKVFDYSPHSSSFLFETDDTEFKELISSDYFSPDSPMSSHHLSPIHFQTHKTQPSIVEELSDSFLYHIFEYSDLEVAEQISGVSKPTCSLGLQNDSPPIKHEIQDTGSMNISSIDIETQKRISSDETHENLPACDDSIFGSFEGSDDRLVLQPLSLRKFASWPCISERPVESLSDHKKKEEILQADFSPTDDQNSSELVEPFDENMAAAVQTMFSIHFARISSELQNVKTMMAKHPAYAHVAAACQSLATAAQMVDNRPFDNFSIDKLRLISPKTNREMQEMLSSNMVIKGVPEMDETLMETIQRLFIFVDCHFNNFLPNTYPYVVDVKRLAVPRGRSPRPIVVKFANPLLMSRLLESAKNRLLFSDEIFPHTCDRKLITFREELTPLNFYILRECERMNLTDDFVDVWLEDGVICFRRLDFSTDVVELDSISAFEKLIRKEPEAPPVESVRSIDTNFSTVD